ncbi:MAG: DUF6067 family protein [Kiritimatiellales bacterium]|nr:DUF6067 family protein [Kiritimatiellales bacterium]
MKKSILLFLALLTSGLPVSARNINDWFNPPPILHVPMLQTEPTIDGDITAAEWQGAARITGFTLHKQKVLAPPFLQPSWWIAWDEHHLYFAQRYPFYPEGTLVATVKEGDKGGANPEAGANIVREDHIEIQLGTLPDREKILDEFFFKLVVNPYNAMEDVRRRHSEGWAGQEWDSNADYKSKVTDQAWTFEIAIPLQSLEYDLPLKDDTTIYCQLVSASDPEGFYSAWAPHGWKAWREFPALVLDRDAPAIRVEDLGPYADGKLDVGLSVVNNTEETTNLTVAARLTNIHGETAFEDMQELAVAAGESKSVAITDNDLELPRDKDLTWDQNYLRRNQQNSLHVEVAGSDGEVLFRDDYRFTPIPNDISENFLKPFAARRKTAKTPVLNSAYMPYYNKLEVDADLDILGMNAIYKKATRLRATVETMLFNQNDAERAGLVHARAEWSVDPDNPFHAVTEVPPLAVGQYAVFLALVDENGNILHEKVEPFRRYDFPWEHNRIGLDTEPIPPFEPLSTGDDTVKIWGRVVRFADTGLPRRIVSQKDTVVEDNMRLSGVVNGEPVELQKAGPFSWRETENGRVTGGGTGWLGDLPVKIDNVTEYDGFMEFRITFEPESKTELDDVRLTISLPERAVNCYIVQEPTAQVGAYGAIPEEPGVFWNSQRMTGAANIKGKFLPNLYIGNGDTGLIYTAVSDQGWILDYDKPSSWLERTDNGVDFVLHLVNTSAIIDKPRTLSFILQPVPVKPLPPDYRRQHGNLGYDEPRRFRSNYLAGYGGGSNTCGGTGPGVDVLTIYDPVDWEVMRDQNLVYKREGWPDYNIPTHRYATTTVMGLGMREFETYSGEWSGKTHIDPHPMGGYNKRMTPFGTFTPEEGTRQWADMTQSNVDMRVWAFDQHQRKAGINGYHWDHTVFWSSGSLIKGTAYQKENGEIQGTNNILLFRQLFKRMANVAYRNAMLNWQGRYAPGITPICAFASQLTLVEAVWYCKGYDQFERFGSLARYRARCGRWQGLPAYHYASVQDRAAEYPHQSRSVVGLALLHDVGAVGHRINQSIYERLVPALQAVDYYNADTEFIPYWRSGKYVTASADGRKMPVSIYLDPDAYEGPKALLVLFNDTDDDADIEIEIHAPALLDKQAPDTVYAAETKKKFGDGPVATHCKRHDYQLILVQ